jgi:type I restriction enzyme S subunit
MSEPLEIPNNWEVLELGSLCSIVSGNTPKGIENVSNSGEIQFYKVSDMNLLGNELFMKVSNNRLTTDEVQKLKIKIYPKGTVIFPKRGGAILTNKKRILGKDASFDLNLMGVVPNQHVLSKLIFYFFYRVDLGKIYDGSSIPQINNKHIEPLLFPLPPLPEQHRIVAKIEELFSELDKGIESLKTAQQQLKVYRQAVLKYAFEGKLTNPAVKDGELPEGWEIVKLGNIFEIFIGSTPSRKNLDYWNGSINWVSSGEVAFCEIRETKEKISKNGLENSSCKIHPPGTIILAMIGEGKTRGQAAILRCYASHNQNTSAILVNPETYISELLYYYLLYTYEKNRGIGSGNNQKALNKERVKNFDIPLFPIKQQEKILQAIESRLSICDKLEESIAQSLQQAETLRQSILKKAFEGKLVPQDPNDEPASILLELIQAERAQAQPAKKARTKKEKA